MRRQSGGPWHQDGDVVLFNPTWWASLPADYQVIINDAFDEVVPALIEHKASAVEDALDAISASEINIRVASPEERAAFRDVMYDRSVTAYIERAGDAGQSLIDVYTANY